MASCSSSCNAAERTKAEPRGRLFRHLQYYEHGCSHKASLALQLATTVFARLPEVP